MTVIIPFKLIAFLIYTGALLGGAFGISVVVTDWRDDAIVTTTQASTGISRVEAQNVARSEAQQAARYAVCISLETDRVLLSGISEGQGDALAEGVRGLCEGETGFTIR